MNCERKMKGPQKRTSHSGVLMKAFQMRYIEQHIIVRYLLLARTHDSDTAQGWYSLAGVAHPFA